MYIIFIFYIILNILCFIFKLKPFVPCLAKYLISLKAIKKNIEINRNDSQNIVFIFLLSRSGV